MKLISLFAFISLSLFSAKLTGQNLGDSLIVITENVSLVKVTDKVYIHRSMLQTNDFGKVSCNGMLYIEGGEASIVDTPTDLPQTEVLLSWLEDQDIQVTSVVVNHFHADCLAGLKAFHSRNIPSYGNLQTQRLALADSLVAPLYTFTDSLVVKVGSGAIVSRFPGQAHTIDNIASYIPSEQVLFGGCMMKALNASKGNLEDANVEQWSKTIEQVRLLFPGMEQVIPGHGKHGGIDLLDYTIEMFKEY